MGFLKSFLNCCAKGRCRQSGDRGNSIISQSTVVNHKLTQTPTPARKSAPGRSCVSEQEEHFPLQRAGFSQALSTAPRGSHLHTAAAPTRIFTAAPFTQRTIQGRYSNPPLWNRGLMCAPCSISSQKEMEVQCGKTSFVLHLAQETEGPPLGLSAMHLLSDYTLGRSAWNLQW